MYYYTRLRRNKTLFGKVARKKLFLKATSPSAFKSTAGSLCLSPITPNSSFLSLHAKYVCFCFFKGQGFFFYKQKKKHLIHTVKYDGGSFMFWAVLVKRLFHEV